MLRAAERVSDRLLQLVLKGLELLEVPNQTVWAVG